MRDKKVELVVKNKLTYLFLLVFPIAIIKIIYDAIQVFVYETLPIEKLGSTIFVALIFMCVSFYFFVRFNTYSALMNPDHPKHR